MVTFLVEAKDAAIKSPRMVKGYRPFKIQKSSYANQGTQTNNQEKFLKIDRLSNSAGAEEEKECSEASSLMNLSNTPINFGLND